MPRALASADGDCSLGRRNGSVSVRRRERLTAEETQEPCAFAHQPFSGVFAADDCSRSFRDSFFLYTLPSLSETICFHYTR